MCFPAWRTHGSDDGGHCRVDNVDIGHLRGGHLEFDLGCTTCTSLTTRGDGRCRGRLPMTYNGSEYLFVVLRNQTLFGFVKALANRRSETIKDAMVDMQL